MTRYAPPVGCRWGCERVSVHAAEGSAQPQGPNSACCLAGSLSAGWVHCPCPIPHPLAHPRTSPPPPPPFPPPFPPPAQVVDLLIKLYKFPNFSISRALLHGTPLQPDAAAPPPPGSPLAAARQGPDVPIGGCRAGQG
jgi:hypothetical protein